MLQQTQVKTVLPYYDSWLKLFPDIKTLARAPLRKVLRAWQGLGYYERARSLWRAARMVVRNFEGQLPQSYERLRSLPGFGPYTTAAVLSFAFGQPYRVIDANVRRVLMRLAGWDGHPRTDQQKALDSWLELFFPQKKSREFNLAIMELGALICRPRNPLCLLCPIRSSCSAFAQGKQKIIPRPKKRPTKKVEGVLAVIRENGRYLIQKRPDKGLFAGLWEFPGGKRERGETLEEALKREVREELQAEVEEVRPLVQVGHAYTRFKVKLTAFTCRFRSRPHLDPKKHRWVGLHSLSKYPLPSGSAKIVRYLENQGRNQDKKG